MNKGRDVVARQFKMALVKAGDGRNVGVAGGSGKRAPVRDRTRW